MEDLTKDIMGRERHLYKDYNPLLPFIERLRSVCLHVITWYHSQARMWPINCHLNGSRQHDPCQHNFELMPLHSARTIYYA